MMQTKLTTTPKVAVLGAGSWGITLASLLLENSLQVSVWDKDKKVLDYISENKTHFRMNQLNLEGITVYDDPVSMVSENELILIVVPSHAFRETIQRIKQAKWQGKTFLICTKGLENSSRKLLSQVMEEELGEKGYSLAILSGPSHAEEVADRKPSSVTIASKDEPLAENLQKIFHTPNFRTYTNPDLIGVQVGAAVKNVLAIAAGICDGLELGDNAKAALITRGLAEISRIGKRLGAHPMTLMGLSGLGDLVVTTMSRHSRNRAFGEYLGKGMSVDEALKKVEMVVEGYYTVETVFFLSKELVVDMPITEAVYRLIYKGGSPQKEVSKLMQREVKEEIYD